MILMDLFRLWADHLTAGRVLREFGKAYYGPAYYAGVLSNERYLPGRAADVGAGKSIFHRLIGAKALDNSYTDLIPSHHSDYGTAENLPYADNSLYLVTCLNAIEHIKDQAAALKEFHRVASRLYICWTPWYSPWGGHDFSPWHYFGKRKGKVIELDVNLFKTTVRDMILLLSGTGWKIRIIRPRYYPKFMSFLAKWKWTREWATWNVEIYAERAEPGLNLLSENLKNT